jgi:hypothetical protein
MKKLVLKLATIVFLFFTVSFSTQAQFMDRGDVLGSGGFYFPSGATLIRASVDFGVSPNVSVGGHFFNVISGGDGQSYIGGRLSYHLGEAFGVRDSRTLDPYVGAQVGKLLVTGAGVGFSLPIGLRFMFNDKVGAYGEYLINLNESSSGIPNMFGLGISFRFNN